MQPWRRQYSQHMVGSSLLEQQDDGHATHNVIVCVLCWASSTSALLCVCTDACVNALSLVDEPDAWLDMSQPWLKRHALPGEQQQQQQGGDEAAPCLTLAGLRAEQALVRAAVLAATSGGPPGERGRQGGREGFLAMTA
jgi:hypothetical protein